MVIPHCRKALGNALAVEQEEYDEKIRRAENDIKSLLAEENDPIIRKVYQAFLANYKYVTLYNLYAARKKGFESRPDFSLRFVQDFYEDNNKNISSLGSETEYDLLNDYPKNVLDAYSQLCQKFDELKSSSSIFDRSEKISIEGGSFFYLNVGAYDIPRFKGKNGTLFFYPSFVLLYKGNADIEIITDLQSINIETVSDSRTVTTEYPMLDVPHDALVLNKRYLYQTKSGKPDARYNHNPCTITYQTNKLSINPGGVEIWFTKLLCTNNFAIAYLSLITENLNSKSSLLVEDDSQLKVVEVADRQFELNQKSTLKAKFNEYIQDPAFVECLKYVSTQSTITTSQLQRHLQIGFNKCGVFLDHLEELMFISSADGLRPRTVSLSEDFLNTILSEDKPKKSSKTKHIVGDKHPNKPWVWTEYAPGKFDWRKNKDTDAAAFPPKATSDRDVSKELDNLIGITGVKEEIAKLQNFIKIQLVRKSQGLKTSPISYHCVFTGNPGTGKTTVARIIAEIYKDLGILSKGHLVETDRSGLVAEFVGQTAVKTNKIIDSALDGVLFIDEAYSLVQGNSNDFGSEAISTLLKRMEDDRDRLVVILAGYRDEMKTFIDANPGLQSRFNRYIHFDDYTADELFEIFSLNATKNQYILTNEASTVLRSKIEETVARKDKNFGNARTVRNMFEKTLEHQATRLTAEGVLDKEALQRITEEDIDKL